MVTAPTQTLPHPGEGFCLLHTNTNFKGITPESRFDISHRTSDLGRRVNQAGYRQIRGEYSAARSRGAVTDIKATFRSYPLEIGVSME